jgi:hypothetical protein
VSEHSDVMVKLFLGGHVCSYLLDSYLTVCVSALLILCSVLYPVTLIFIYLIFLNFAYVLPSCCVGYLTKLL